MKKVKPNKLKKIQIYMSDDEIQELKKVSSARNISTAEMIRLSVRNEINGTNSINRISALDSLINLIT